MLSAARLIQTKIITKSSRSFPALPRVSFSRSFSTGVVYRKGSSLLETLTEELRYEKEEKELESQEDGEMETFNVKKFHEQLKKMKFNVVGGQGGHESNEVKVERVNGNEKVTFAVGIVPTYNDDTEAFNDQEDADEDEEEVSSVSYPVTIDITKQGEGTLTVFGNASPGEFIEIEQVEFCKDTKLATAEDAESDMQRKGKYMGPQFEYLDENLQDAFHDYLEELGISSDLTNLVLDYAEHHEQAAYVNWLSSVKSFVEKK